MYLRCWRVYVVGCPVRYDVHIHGITLSTLLTALFNVLRPRRSFINSFVTTKLASLQDDSRHGRTTHTKSIHLTAADCSPCELIRRVD